MISLIVFLLFHNFIHNSSALRNWSFELTKVDFVTSDETFMSGDLEVERISRGEYGVSGYIDFKESFDDDNIKMDVIIYRDKFCKGNYEVLPYSFINYTITNIMNSFYKESGMETLKECAKNAPVFEKFSPPLTERRMVLSKCKFSEDDFPSYMNDGCYLLEISFRGRAESKILSYSVVESQIG